MIDVLELLNEPAGFRDGWTPIVRQFFSDAYTAVRAAVGNSLNIMIGDAFQGVDSWQGFLTNGNGGIGVLMDYVSCLCRNISTWARADVTCFSISTKSFRSLSCKEQWHSISKYVYHLLRTLSLHAHITPASFIERLLPHTRPSKLRQEQHLDDNGRMVRRLD